MKGSLLDWIHRKLYRTRERICDMVRCCSNVSLDNVTAHSWLGCIMHVSWLTAEEKLPVIPFENHCKGFCIIVYTFHFWKDLCGCICCGWVWLHYFQQFSKYEQTWSLSSLFCEMKCSCWVDWVLLWSYLTNCDSCTFKMNKQYQNKLLWVYQWHLWLLALRLVLEITAMMGAARVSTLTYNDHSVSFV